MWGLVIGERGQLGSCLRGRADEGWTFVGGDVLDLSRPGEFAGVLGGFRPDAIINAAAYTAVDRAETEPEIAFAVNEAAQAALSRWCTAHRAAFIHMSTDYGFAGSATACVMRTSPAPNRLWREQIGGERAVAASGARPGFAHVLGP